MGVVRYNWGIAPGSRSKITGRVREGRKVTLKVHYAVVTLQQGIDSGQTS